MLAWLSVWIEVQTCVWPSCCHCHSLSLASVKSRLVLRFWYWLTRLVPNKGPLDARACVRARAAASCYCGPVACDWTVLKLLLFCCSGTVDDQSESNTPTHGPTHAPTHDQPVVTHVAMLSHVYWLVLCGLAD